MKNSRRTTTTIILFIITIGVIAVTLALSRKVQKTDTTAQKSSAASCAVRFVVAPPTNSSTPVPSQGLNPISWQTNRATLTADDFYIQTSSGKKFTTVGLTVSPHSDPGNPTYTSLELEWNEQGGLMRMYMYFHSDGKMWWVSEMRTYDGNPSPVQFEYFKKNTPLNSNTLTHSIFSASIGSVYTGDFLSTSSTSGYTESGVPAANASVIYFKNLKLRGFTQYSSPYSTPSPTPVAGRVLKFLVKFAGVTQDRGAISVKYSDGGALAGTLSFTHSGNGVYQGLLQVPSNYALQTNVTFELKPEKHLQRVFKSWPVNADIVDLTSKVFEPGDLPVQDGIVNLLDLNRVLSLLAKPVQTTSDFIVGDVNYDGVVNAADMSSILSTLSTHPDESL